MERTHWVMDWETLSNCSLVVFQDYKSDLTKTFVLHDLRNDFQDLIEFLKRNVELNEKHISFNGLDFDAQITEYIIRNHNILLDMSGCEIAAWIYEKAQYIIETKNKNEFLEFSPYNLTIKQLDVYKLNHWDNAAKRSSLTILANYKFL